MRLPAQTIQLMVHFQIEFLVRNYGKPLLLKVPPSRGSLVGIRDAMYCVSAGTPRASLHHNIYILLFSAMIPLSMRVLEHVAKHL